MFILGIFLYILLFLICLLQINVCQEERIRELERRIKELEIR
jgi:hypothetical protein